MRKILIVGSGQSGLQLALSLLGHGYDVTVASARTPEEVYRGRVMSTQCMFDTALQHERDQGINIWEEDAPRIEGLGVSVAGEGGERLIDWVGMLDGYAQSVDQRVKMAGWMEEFENRGGNLVIHGVTLSDLDRFVNLYDLVVVAAGRGELVELFGRDASRSPYTEPQRALAVSYVHGMGPRPEHPDFYAVRCNLVPGAGELFVMPALTTTGACNILFFEGIPGGPLDRFADIRDPQEHLDQMLDLMRTFVPWEYERARDAELTDAHGTLQGRFTPTVRNPVGRLPSGGAVLGMADVVVSNDPIVGQGSNNASKCAALYLEAIREQEDRPFDEEFMRRTFDRFWDTVQYSTNWSNAMLQPPPPHVLQLLGAGGQYQQLADRFANGFNNPADLFEWFMDPDKAEAYLAELQGAATVG
jgi:hypothetical protein